MSFKRAALEERTPINSTEDCVHNILPHPSRCSLGKWLSPTLASCMLSLGSWDAPAPLLPALIRIIHKKTHTSSYLPCKPAVAPIFPKSGLPSPFPSSLSSTSSTGLQATPGTTKYHSLLFQCCLFLEQTQQETLWEVVDRKG